MMKNEIIGTYLANRALSHDLIAQLSEEELDLVWNRPGLNSFRKHFQEMNEVQDAYREAIISGNMSFESVTDVFSFDDSISKDRIIKDMKVSDEILLETINNASENQTIHWFDMDISLYTHITNLIQHEVYHQGMMTLSLYEFGIQIPNSWIENWALPKNE